ncbi:MAG TPA: GAF domain-containing protein, partial [Trichocoleus sp.]
MVQTFPDGSDIYEAVEAANHEQTALTLALPELSETALAADWLALIEQHSQLAIALLELNADPSRREPLYSVRFATAVFERLLAGQSNAAADRASLLKHLPDSASLQQRLRLLILNDILQRCYGATAGIDERLLQEPILVMLPGSEAAPTRYLELRLVSSAPLVHAVSDVLQRRLAACWQDLPTTQTVMAQLLAENSPLAQLREGLTPSDCQIKGHVLLEGQEVTERELASTLMQLLVSRESVLEPQKFGRANALMKQLFGADSSLILSAENSHVKLFTGLDQPEWEVQTYPMQMLQSSFFEKANQVLNIADLSLSCSTEFEQDILAAGVRSLLIIPLVAKSTTFSSESRHLLGLVGLTSKRPYAFTEADCGQATRLIPALTAALRHTVQDRFTNIHSSVRWRFEQEAERRSWGLPPEPIVFENVYPLYGISDVRGSSEERNRAIQTDLLSQFRLAQAVMEAVCTGGSNAFAQQFRLDLAEHIEALTIGITVEAEVTLLRYLQETLEVNFDFFATCSPAAAQAVTAYRNALNP